MVITPGVQFEPPYVGSYNQGRAWGGWPGGAFTDRAP